MVHGRRKSVSKISTTSATKLSSPNILSPSEKGGLNLVNTKVK
jgi:hypothetical protein